MEEPAKKKSRFRLTIGNKILGSFIILIVLFIVVVTIIFMSSNTIDSTVRNSGENFRPSKDAINDMILMVTRSRMLATNWVYLQSNDEDKQALRELHAEFPNLRKRIDKLKVNWDKDRQKDIDFVFTMFDNLITIQKESIMANLQRFENYEDPTVKFLAENSIESEVTPMTTKIIKKLNELANQQTRITTDSDNKVIASIDTLRNLTVILGGIFLVLSLISAFYLLRSVTKPVNFLKNIVVKLGRGNW